MQRALTRYGRWIFVCVVVVVSLTAIWWHAVYQSPKRAFWDMLSLNLSTSSVTKNEVTSGSDNSVTQHISLQLGEQNASRWLVTVTQKTGSVTTDSIGTPTAGYVRYTHVADSKGQAGAKYAGVVNVWAKAPASDTNSSLSTLFSDALLDMGSAPVPPIGNVPAGTRADMLEYIAVQQVFAPDFSKVKEVNVNGRKTYEIPVKVKLAPYIRLMQVFAHTYGLTSLDDISATDYQAAQPVTVQVYVDVLSHRLARIVYPTTGFNETYTDYGVERDITLPTKTVNETVLQNKLKAVR